MRKPEVLELAQNWHYLPVVDGKEMLCAECGEIVARRRGPAKGGWWQATENMDPGCLPGSTAAAGGRLIICKVPTGGHKPTAPPAGSGPPQRPFIAPGNGCVKLA